MSILVTGAAGFIGSHVVLELLQAGHQVLAVDNFSNSLPSVYGRLARLNPTPFVQATLDVRDTEALKALVQRHRAQACIHLAAFKAVGDSEKLPLDYWWNNLQSLLSVIEAMESVGGRRLVFSSSATVYGAPTQVPVPEQAPLKPESVYAATKLAGEYAMAELQLRQPPWDVAILRYFNPIGAHPSGMLGEDPRGVPNNLMPYVAQVAAGQRPEVAIFGHDYPTPDGTCVRDYIHVVDLARGHLAALRRLLAQPGSFTVNLGTGRGTSVLELVQAFERVNGVAVPHRFAPRRPGDCASYYADCRQAQALLGWEAQLDIEDMCRDTWRWQQHLRDHPEPADQRGQAGGAGG